jgi:hypothetical protein
VWTALEAAAMGVGRVGAAPRAERWMDPIQGGSRLGDPGRCLAIAIQGYNLSKKKGYKGVWGPGLRDGRLLLAGEEMGTGRGARSQGRVVLLSPACWCLYWDGYLPAEFWNIPLRSHWFLLKKGIAQWCRSAGIISRLKNTIDWFFVREKYCSDWKNKPNKTDYKSDEQGQ